jgi:hypothetical protein
LILNRADAAAVTRQLSLALFMDTKLNLGHEHVRANASIDAPIQQIVQFRCTGPVRQWDRAMVRWPEGSSSGEMRSHAIIKISEVARGQTLTVIARVAPRFQGYRAGVVILDRK